MTLLYTNIMKNKSAGFLREDKYNHSSNLMTKSLAKL